MAGDKTLLAILVIGMLIIVGVANGADNRKVQVAVSLNVPIVYAIHAGVGSVALSKQDQSVEQGYDTYQGTDSVSISCNNPRGFFLLAQDLAAASSPKPGYMINPSNGKALSMPMQVALPFQTTTTYKDLNGFGILWSSQYPYADDSGNPISYSDGEIGFQQLVSQDTAIDTPDLYAISVDLDVSFPAAD